MARQKVYELSEQIQHDMTDSKHIVEARAVEKFYEEPDKPRIQVISPTNLTIDENKIIALLGPSGCGKSTLLRMLTGLAQPSSGQVLWHGEPLDGRHPNAAIVFQSFALFPWLTVVQNVEVPLEAMGVEREERNKLAMKMLDVVGLDGFETAYPKELSGGMKQRVGFARAMVVEPEVLFMDEPFSALDVLTAENLRSELMELWLSKKMPTKSIFIVTHNIDEAILLADRVIVLGTDPARIRADFEVGMEQWRDRKSPRFVELVDYVYKVLTQPKRDVAPPQAAARDAAVATPAEAKYSRLPHARPGGIAGLMELLADRQGKDDLYRLAKELTMEVDDLLPIVEASVLFGFATVHEGDVEITDLGRQFGEADILTQKTIFREAGLANIRLLEQIDRALKSKSDHTLPDEFFRDILDEHFSEEEAERQLSTALLWGRYAEIFDYDAANGRLILTDQ